ncbi:MAG: hypothetical protein HYU69_15975, partial [Bacteroidetes bacterium]|nr:hypothetical protein [Bacteroidota bacterium]
MKSIQSFCIIGILLISSHMFAGEHSDPDQKAKAEELMARQKPLGFQENKGQMTDMEGNPVPNVLYKVSSPGLDIFVT